MSSHDIANVFNFVDRGFEPQSGQTKDFKIGICCFSAEHTGLRRKSKDWLFRSQENVSEWDDMSIRGLLFTPPMLFPNVLKVFVHNTQVKFVLLINHFC
jgi:hypothetical protein